MRIRIKARIDQPSQEPLAGILVYEGYEQDAFGRSTLGRPVAATSSTAGRWQQVDLYRIVSSDSPARVYFELRGAVAVTLDDLSIETLMLTPSNPNYVTTPINGITTFDSADASQATSAKPFRPADENRVLEPILNK